jgi:hypothetical protein
MAIREGRWDCPSCGNKGILGRDMACPKCSFRRPEGVAFYLPEDAEVVTDEALLKRATSGADWVCEWCAASNVATAHVCTQCGAERGTSPSQKVKDYDTSQVPRSAEEPAPKIPPPPSSAKRKIPPSRIAIIVGIVLFVVMGGYFLFRTKDVAATITGMSWERTIAIERLTTVVEEGSSVPAGGRMIRTSNVQVSEKYQTGTETYVCGKTDLGNGMFKDKECERSIYATRYRTEIVYTYEIDRWIQDRTERASGTDRKPYWPRSNLSDDEREGNRHEHYLLHTKDSATSKTYDVQLSQEKWKDYNVGEKVKLKVNALGAKIDDAKAE